MKIKRKIAFLLIFLMSINSFATSVSNNDGSAFITKAEFDALKSSFQAQIDTYNQGIDSKIDGAIASYLAGITINMDKDVDSTLYTVLQQTGNTGFYNIKGAADNWSYEPKITFTGTHFMQCGYRAIFYRAMECYTGYLISHALKTAIGNVNNYIELYDTVGTKKIHNRVIKGFSLSYNLNSTQYDAGNQLYYGGWFRNIYYNNRCQAIFAPGTEQSVPPYICTVDETGFNNQNYPSSQHYVASNEFIPNIGNAFIGAATSSVVWSAARVWLKDSNGRGLTNVYTGYRYDYKFSDLTHSVPVYDASTQQYNVFPATADMNQSTSYRVRTASLSNTFRASFGGGPMLWASDIGYNRTTNPTHHTAVCDVDLFTLNTTSNINANTINNKYIYDYCGIFLPNNEVYLPLLIYRDTNNGTANFEFKANTTAGNISIYENSIGTTTINAIDISGINASTGASIGNAESTLNLAVSTNYKIQFDIGSKKNYIIKWIPSNDSAGANTFTTSKLISLKYND